MARKQREETAASSTEGSGLASPSIGIAPAILRPPAEMLEADELRALAQADRDPRPPGWKLSPRAVRSFICGGERPAIARKFFGDDAMVERAIVSLSSNRGLMLVGEPGTAKSMLSELLAAAISGTLDQCHPGHGGDHRGPHQVLLELCAAAGRRAVAAGLWWPRPSYVAMRDGLLVRFEEITRCPPEIQDTLVSVLSEKVMIVPELDGPDRVLHARPGFNVIGTANTRDRGVNEMSSALKRRFNFETIHPIKELKQEVELVTRECDRLLREAAAADRGATRRCRAPGFRLPGSAPGRDPRGDPGRAAQHGDVDGRGRLGGHVGRSRRVLLRRRGDGAAAHRPASRRSGPEGQSRRPEEAEALLRRRCQAAKSEGGRALDRDAGGPQEPPLIPEFDPNAPHRLRAGSPP